MAVPRRRHLADPTAPIVPAIEGDWRDFVPERLELSSVARGLWRMAWFVEQGHRQDGGETGLYCFPPLDHPDDTESPTLAIDAIDLWLQIIGPSARRWAWRIVLQNRLRRGC